MADGQQTGQLLTTPGYSWMNNIAGLMNQINPNNPQAQQQRMLQAYIQALGQRQLGLAPHFANQGNTDPRQWGQNYTGGPRGFGIYEGNIRTPANPYGTLRPNLGAPNTPMPAPGNPWTGTRAVPFNPAMAGQGGQPGMPPGAPPPMPPGMTVGAGPGMMAGGQPIQNMLAGMPGMPMMPGQRPPQVAPQQSASINPYENTQIVPSL